MRRDDLIDSKMIKVNGNKISLEDYLNSSNDISISYFYEISINQAIEDAISFLKKKKSGSVYIPPSYGYATSEVRINCKINKKLESVITYELYNYRYPNSETESRPYDGGDWQVGDKIFNSDYSNNKNLGWVCIEAGTPGTWISMSSSGSNQGGTSGSHLNDVYVSLTDINWAEEYINGAKCYSQTVDIEGINENEAPIVALSSSNSVTSDEEYEAYSLISDVVSMEGSLKFIASDLPTVSITVIIKSGNAKSGDILAGDFTNLVNKVNDNQARIIEAVNKVSNIENIADELFNNAVFDDAIGEDETIEIPDLNDADTLGGRYTAEDLDAMPKSSAVEDYAGAETPEIDADKLGGKYTAEDLDNKLKDIPTTMEQVEASTDLSKPVGAGAVQELNNSLGDCELLCYATSTGNKTVPNITKYKSVLAVLLIDGTAYGTSLIPVSLFKTISSSRCSYYDASGQYKCDYKYVDDTTINVIQINTNNGCYIYGVK